MDKRFNGLRERLLRAGIAPRHVRRYLAELEDHRTDLQAQEEASGLNSDDARAAALLRLGTEDALFNAMAGETRLRSWSCRAPWATFGFAPLALLAGAYLFACLYLWFGWTTFLPGTDTPFGARMPGPIYSWASLYFQAGKYFYIFAPLLVGWAIAVMALRQRCRAIWPVLGMASVAWMGGTAQIQASRSAVPNHLGNIGMSAFVPGPSLRTNVTGFVLIFLFAAVPYVAWRFQQQRRFLLTRRLADC